MILRYCLLLNVQSCIHKRIAFWIRIKSKNSVQLLIFSLNDGFRLNLWEALCGQLKSMGRLAFSFRAEQWQDHCVNLDIQLHRQVRVILLIWKDTYSKISLTELVNELVVLSMLPIYFNALERTTVLGVTGYLWMRTCAQSTASRRSLDGVRWGGIRVQIHPWRW